MASPFEALEIREDGRQEQEPAEDVAPLGDPRHRLDAERVDAPEQRRERPGHHDGAGRLSARRAAAPGRGEQAPGDRVDERRVGGVEDQVRQVVPPGVHPTEGVVDSEAQPRQRDVVAHERRGEHPLDLRPAQAPEVRVGHEVDRVIPVEELPAQRGKEHDAGDEEDERGQEQAGPAEPRHGRGDGPAAGTASRERAETARTSASSISASPPRPCARNSWAWPSRAWTR